MASYSVELGWMVSPVPCSKEFWYDTAIPGVRLPSVKFAEQRIYAYVSFDSENMRDEALQAVKDCALAAVGAAGGIGAITANPSAALSAFSAAFFGCFAAQFADIVMSNVDLPVKSVCMW